MQGTGIRCGIRCQVQKGNTIISVQQKPWIVPSLIFVNIYNRTYAQVYLKKNPSAATMLLQHSIFPKSLPFLAFRRTARIQGNQSKSLHKNIWKLNTHIQLWLAKRRFFPNLQQVLPAGQHPCGTRKSSMSFVKVAWYLNLLSLTSLMKSK